MVTRHHASSSAFQVYCLTPTIASKLIGSVLISLARGLGGKTYQLSVSRGWLLPARYSSRAVVIITDPSVMVILTEGVSSFWDPDLFGGVEHRFSFCTVCCCFEASLMAETSIESMQLDWEEQVKTLAESQPGRSLQGGEVRLHFRRKVMAKVQDMHSLFDASRPRRTVLQGKSYVSLFLTGCSFCSWRGTLIDLG
ncbi:hypothetical protein BS50DRAFT_355969 [Corynespora cassiicola Philippines]|uniref:Uncharacterized protein n=1 Tax=Corynespora cassiicola Philippines TaxID=1448308 RepID=A0A2T2NRM5_CORCC|nr:hypothetical protein BS50DRAFT_355969 [Corynespora cassiicola Philippines]